MLKQMNGMTAEKICLLKKFEITYNFNSVVVQCDFGGKFYFTFPNFILHLFFLRLNVNLFFKTTRDDLNVHAMIRMFIVPHQRIVSQTSSHLDLGGVSWICLLLFALLWNRCGIKSLVRTIALQQVHRSTMIELFDWPNQDYNTYIVLSIC